MATLFIIDQSLKDMAGHHYDYTRLVAEAASEIGITPVIGANRLLRGDAARELSQLGELEKPFRRCTYSNLSYLSGLRELTDKKRSQKNRRSRVPKAIVPDLNQIKIPEATGLAASCKAEPEKSE